MARKSIHEERDAAFQRGYQAAMRDMAEAFEEGSDVAFEWVRANLHAAVAE